MVSVLVTLHPDNQLLHRGCTGTVMVCNTLQHLAHTQTITDLVELCQIQLENAFWFGL